MKDNLSNSQTMRIFVSKKLKKTSFFLVSDAEVTKCYFYIKTCLFTKNTIKVCCLRLRNHPKNTPDKF